MEMRWTLRSPTIISVDRRLTSVYKMSPKKIATPVWMIHPGEILREEFLKPMGLTANELARSIHVPAPRINDIVLERRGITADTAVRLARFFRYDRGILDEFAITIRDPRGSAPSSCDDQKD